MIAEAYCSSELFETSDGAAKKIVGSSSIVINKHVLPC
jgi:hypothetical protein